MIVHLEQCLSRLEMINVFELAQGTELYLGPFIRSLRIELGITQAFLSSEIGFSVQTISKFENGESNPRATSAIYIVNYILGKAGMGTLSALKEFERYCELAKNG